MQPPADHAGHAEPQHAPSLHRTVAGLGIATIASYGGWFYGSEILPQRHLGALLGAVHAIGGAAGAARPLVGGLTATATGSYGLAVTRAGMAFLVAAAAVASRPGMPSDADPWVASGADVQDPVVPPPA